MSQIASLLLTLLPIIIILFMLIIWKKPADVSGIVGWLAISLVALLFFSTSIEVIFRSTIAGIIRSFPVSLIVATSLLMMAFMEVTGGLKRIIIFIKTIACENQAVQIMLISIGFGTLMVAVGATPVSLLPPILLALGYSTYTSIALPAIGYDSLCTYALLGAPLVVFIDIANGFLAPAHHLTPSQVGSVFFMFLPLVSTLIGFCMLWIVGKMKAIRQGWLPVLVTGATITLVSYFTNRVDNLVALTGVLAGLAVIIAMVIYLKVTGKKVIDKSRLSKEELDYEKKYPLWKAFTPWIILIVIILALNVPKEIYTYLYETLKLPISGISADGKDLTTRALWNAYTWIFVSLLLSMIFIRPSVKHLKETVKVWWKRAPRPVFSAAIFFAIGEIMNTSNYTGYQLVDKLNAAGIMVKVNVLDQGINMVKVLADTSAQFFQHAYSAVASFIGLFAGFITGSEASSIAMFSTYSMKTSTQLGFSTTNIIIVAAALAFGSGLASVISPAKLQNAAASIDKMGEENKVIRIAFVFSLGLTAITAIYTVILLSLNIKII